METKAVARSQRRHRPAEPRAGLRDEAQPRAPASALEPRGLVGPCPSAVPTTPMGQIQGRAPRGALRLPWALQDGSSCSAFPYPTSPAASPGCSQLPAALPLGPAAPGCPLRGAGDGDGDGAQPGDALQLAWCRRRLRRGLCSLPWARTRWSAFPAVGWDTWVCPTGATQPPARGPMTPLEVTACPSGG